MHELLMVADGRKVVVLPQISAEDQQIVWKVNVSLSHQLPVILSALMCGSI